jgi:hypothetical protein
MGMTQCFTYVNRILEANLAIIAVVMWRGPERVDEREISK